MTDLTDDQVRALLKEAGPGPWDVDGPVWNRTVWRSSENRVCFMSHSNGLNDERDIATSNLAAAAPDLARALLQAHADAAAAQAQCCMCGKTGLSTAEDGGPECELHDGRWVCSAACWDIASALAPAEGTAELARLRDGRDHAVKRVAHLEAALSGGVLTKADSMDLMQRLGASEASLAAQTALVATLTGALREARAVGHKPQLVTPDYLQARAASA